MIAWCSTDWDLRVTEQQLDFKNTRESGPCMFNYLIGQNTIKVGTGPPVVQGTNSRLRDNPSKPSLPGLAVNILASEIIAN